MKLVVLDCSMVVPWFFPEEDSSDARALLMEYQQRKVACTAPSLLPLEFAAVVGKKYRRGHCLEKRARDQVNRIRLLPLWYERWELMFDQAFEVSLRTGCAVYDCVYLVLALNKNAILATLDKHQQQGARQLGVELYR